MGFPATPAPLSTGSSTMYSPLQVNPLRNWSFKKWWMYKVCPMQVRLKYIEKIPEPEPDPRFDAKRQRGIELHERLAESINLGAPVPQNFQHVEPIVEAYRDLGAVAELEEFYNRQWEPVEGWNDAWVQIIKDVRIRVPEFALVGDWKTGRKSGNELKYFEQMKLYAVSEWIVNPGLPEYITELQFVDEEETWEHSFKPHQLEKYLGDFERDIHTMMSDLVFRPKPSKYNCQYCPYGPNRGNGKCPVGV